MLTRQAATRFKWPAGSWVPSIMIWKHPIPHIRPMQDRDAERRGAPESGPGVRLTGVLWSSWGDGWGVLW